jgi:hypothetical protein
MRSSWWRTVLVGLRMVALVGGVAWYHEEW